MQNIHRNIKKFNAILFDRKFYDDNEDLIHEAQIVSFDLFSSFGMIISSTNVLLQIVIGKLPSFIDSMMMLLYCIIMYICFHRYAKDRPSKSHGAIYGFQIPILVLAILMGTVFDPNTVAFSFPIAIITLPLFIIDHPKNIIIYILTSLLVFLVMDAAYKPCDIVFVDFVHLVIFGQVSLLASLYALYLRIISIRGVINTRYIAEHDPLTGCFNRRGVEEFAVTKWKDHSDGALIIIDVDNFKGINDTYGHHVGDMVLIAIADTIQQNRSFEDCVVRIGGDEFAVYSPYHYSEEELCKKLDRFFQDLTQLKIENCNSNITVSVGAIIHHSPITSLDAIYEKADSLLYSIKNKNKNDFAIQIIE